MFPFDVILFDVGGVLLTNGWDHSERATVLDRFGLDRDAFELRHSRHYRDWEIGAISVESYLDATVFYEPRAFSQDDLFASICAQSKLLPNGGLGILQELTASDKCMLGALNNEARETNEYRFNHFGLRNAFQISLSSCYLGLRKPESVIYKCALDLLGRPPERILFIDDREENAIAAVAAGMKAIRFTGANTLRQELEFLGVL
jgi:putative hydrolase of the HAD superfamily